MTDVVKLSLLRIVMYFVIYIVLHYLIIRIHSTKQKELEKDSTKEDLQKQVKFLDFLRKWFPAIYVIMILITLV
jgi:hypothetical protein